MDINKVVERTTAALKISKSTVINVGRENCKKERNLDDQEEVEVGPLHAIL